MGPGCASTLSFFPDEDGKMSGGLVDECGHLTYEEEKMKINIQGLGGRLQRARKGTGLSQEAVGKRIGVSWMTVHRWERSQRSVSEENLDRLCELYDKPLRWFLTLEEGDFGDNDETSKTASDTPRSTSSAAAKRLSQKISDAPEVHRPMIEKIVEDLLDGLRRAA